MDLFLLQAVAAESAGRLLEQRLLRVSHLGLHRYLLRFASPHRDNLLLSVRPDLPRFHLLPGESGRVREEAADPFAALLDGELGGSVLEALEARPWDRVVEMRFRLPPGEDGPAGRRLVVELFGRSANALLLDLSGMVRGAARNVKTAFREQVVGRAYEPPARRPEYEALPAGAAALPAIRSRWGSPGEFLDPLSPLLARDLRIVAAADPEAAFLRLAEVLEAAARGAWAPVVYSPGPLHGASGGSEAPGGDDPRVAPLPLRAMRDSQGVPTVPALATPFASPSAAAAAAFGPAERLRDFARLRDRHLAQVRRELDRLETLVRRIEGDREAALGCERYRRFGEALLAGLRSARVEGESALVPDPRSPEGERLAVPIDPARSLQDNAQTLFARYKKGKRGRAPIETRLEAARGRGREWRALLDDVAAAVSADDLEKVREAMARLGLVHAPARRRTAAAVAALAAPARVRRHTSPDGLVILVGRSGAENDTLTFGVAAPWDFWLHAAGHPGAHVVVRNPQRLLSLPAATLRLAAEIAAFYSGAKGEGGAEVHYTQRKHVRKRRGMSRGEVVLRRFRSVRVTPRLPAAAEQV